MAWQLSISIPDADAWLLDALEAYRKHCVANGPPPSIAEIVRDALRVKLEAFRAVQGSALREDDSREEWANGCGESDPWFYLPILRKLCILTIISANDCTTCLALCRVSASVRERAFEL